MKIVVRPFCVILCIVAFAVSGRCQLYTSPASDINDLAHLIVPPGFTISSVQHTGSTGAIGFFNGASTNIGLNNGIIMTTGVITGHGGPDGPNHVPDAGVDMHLPGPPEPVAAWLDYEINGTSGFHDSNLLSFYVTGQDSILRFQFVFGSEEYNEFVNTQYGDAFAIFVQGPGIPQPYVNIAKPSDTSSAISINSVNNGYSDGCSNGNNNPTNPNLYVDNCNGLTIQYDGFTKVITASVHIIPQQTYHVWFVIADVADGIYDSGVFIKGVYAGAGIPENQTAASPQVFPNPSEGRFTLSGLSGKTRLSVTNTAGQIVWQQTLTQTGNADIHLDELPAGIYFLTQTTGNESHTVKIAIHR